MHKTVKSALALMASAFLLASCSQTSVNNEQSLSPVEYVNPYMGNISHLLVPTFPTVHLPNSMLRAYPERADFTADRLGGLPVTVTNHRERSAFNISREMKKDCSLLLL